MGTRYNNRSMKVNEDPMYDNVFKKRGVKKIRQYTTPVFPEITPELRSMLVRQQHIWTIGDSYEKLSAMSYGMPGYWWVIAWYNKRPTDALVNVGDIVFIPRPLETILEIFRK